MRSMATYALTRRLMALVVLAGLQIGAGAAWGADSSQTGEVDQLYLEGVTLYKAGRYKSAIKRFSKAYELYPDPKLLYNIGRCHESRGDLERALQVYAECLAHQEASPRLKEKAERRTKLVKQVQSRNAKTLATPEAPASAPARSGGGTTGAAAGSRIGAAPPPAMQPERSSPLSVAKWITGGAGLLLVAGGITAIMLGVSDQKKVDDAIDGAGEGGTAQMRRVEALELQDDANTKKIVGYALSAAGAAAVIGSALLFYFDSRGGDGERMSAVDLTVAYQPGGGATLGLTGAF